MPSSSDLEHLQPVMADNQAENIKLLRDVIIKAADEVKADFVIIDLGPTPDNLNRACVLISDVVQPTTNGNCIFNWMGLGGLSGALAHHGAMIQLGSTPSAGPGAAAAASFWAAARQQQQGAWTALGAAGRNGGQALGGSRQASLLPHTVALGPGGGEGGTQPLHDLPVATSDAASAPAGLAAPGPPLTAAAAGEPPLLAMTAATGTLTMLQQPGPHPLGASVPGTPQRCRLQLAKPASRGSCGSSTRRERGPAGGRVPLTNLPPALLAFSPGVPMLSSGEWDPLGQDMELGPGDE
ncbi:hypothetical protein HaLaN_19679 [Haematococcus lacustris]|uniref:Uncharacterized protein n=1 Tax=Haematococcus lacustris TaxID=44745 RepID=A0A699ZU73_HAELA|nr:hypothetical protein HaLaN_19679 [Haematococcus lacustris]